MASSVSMVFRKKDSERAETPVSDDPVSVYELGISSSKPRTCEELKHVSDERRRWVTLTRCAGLGNLLVDRGDLEESKVWFAQGSELGDPRCSFNLGTSQLKLGDREHS